MTKKPDKISEALVNGIAVDSMKSFGLFAVPLNNGEWMVGKANYAYSLNVGSDHYKDEELSIAPTLLEAVSKWANEHL